MKKETIKYIYIKYVYPNLPIFIYTLFYLIFFSPTLLSGKILAPNDGIAETYPNYYSLRSLWTTMLYSGFPSFADPLEMRWYLPRIIATFFKIPYSYFVIFPFIVASFLTYKFVYYLTKSKLAGFISGIIFGCNGFFMAHLGLIYMVQSGSWLPGILLGISKLKNRYNKKWYILTAIFVSLCILGGNPQVFTYSLIIATLYILGNGYTKKDKKILYITQCLSILFIGICISSIQLLPTYELMRLSIRNTDMSTVMLNASMSPSMLITLFFPYIVGCRTPNSFYPNQAKIQPLIPEFIGYTGISSIALSIIGILKNKKDKQILFWSGIALISMFLIMGKYTNFGYIMAKIPLINLFQVATRNFFEFSVAISVLVGYGVSTLQRNEYQKIKKIILITIIILSTIVTTILANIYIWKNDLTKLLEYIYPIWKNPSIWIPVAITMAMCLYLFFFGKIKKNNIKYILLVIIVITDVSSYGQFAFWRYESIEKSTFIPPTGVIEIKNDVQEKNNRIWSLNGVDGAWFSATLNEIPPKISKLWEIPNISGYSPMELTRYNKLLNMNSSGIVENGLYETNLAYNLLSTKYMLVDKENKVSELLNQKDIRKLLSKNNNEIEIPIENIKATTIQIESQMGNSANIPENYDVAYMEITTKENKIYKYTIKAGRDTSEWAWDRKDVQKVIKHSRAKISQSFEEKDAENNSFLSHMYLGEIDLNKYLEIKKIKIIWNNKSGNMELLLNSLKLIDKKTGQEYFPEQFGEFTNNGNWKYVKNIGDTSVYENTKLMPRAWMVSNTLTLKPEEILSTIQTGKLLDGKNFEPVATALIEEPSPLSVNNSNIDHGKIKNLMIDEESVSMNVSSKKQNFIILSDVYYPGWKAYIDGKETKIYQTDYILRGIVVPEGEHLIQFMFKPQSLYLGAIISILSILMLIIIAH